MNRSVLGSALGALLLTGMLSAATPVAAGQDQAGPATESLRIGWASADITPDRPVALAGQHNARVSEGVMDPVTATVLAIESPGGELAILVSCDLISINEPLRDRIRALVRESLPAVDIAKIVINATHTHTAPETRFLAPDRLADIAATLGCELTPVAATWGVELEAMTAEECQQFIAARVAGAVVQAWQNRRPGGVSFGLGQAVVGHNRLTAYGSGESKMYGKTRQADFSHIEGYEDHAVNLLFTWDASRKLTGVVVNVACPSQVSEHLFQISADYWHDTRVELRRRLGDGLFVLPQCSAAGDQAPRTANRNDAAERRMEQITGRTRRQQIAVRIADAVESVLPHMEKQVDWHPVFAHRAAVVALARRLITEDDVKQALAGSAKAVAEYRRLLAKTTPEAKAGNRRWYAPITRSYRYALRGWRVKERFQAQQSEPQISCEIHVIRIGELAIATNPFELYLDYGIQIRERSPAVQTFLVQLAGGGTYLPTARAIAGGAYGSTPSSTTVGPEGGKELVEKTLRMIGELWEERKN